MATPATGAPSRHSVHSVTRHRWDSEAEGQGIDPTGLTVRSSAVVKRVPTRSFIDQTISVWQPFTSRSLTREDGRQIAQNAIGFFQILDQWARAERPALARQSPELAPRTRTFIGHSETKET